MATVRYCRSCDNHAVHPYAFCEECLSYEQPRFEALQGTGWTGDAWWQLYDHKSRICIGPRHDTREACEQFMLRMAQLSLMEERGL